MNTIIDDIPIRIDGELPDEEIKTYLQRGRDQYGKRLRSIDIKPDGEFVDIRYHLGRIPFERIRRITGYLVGTIDRFNNGKRAEEKDRVKHGI